MTILFPRIERSRRTLLAVPLFVSRINQKLDVGFILYFSSFEFKGASGGARTRRSQRLASSCVPGIEATNIQLDYRFHDYFYRKNTVEMARILEPSENFRRSDDNLSGVVSATWIVVLAREVQTAFAENTGIAENGALSNDMFFVGLDKEAGGNFSAKLG